MSSPTTRADATTTVRVYQQVVYDGPAEGPALSRIHLGELFSGDIEACGITEFLQSVEDGQRLGLPPTQLVPLPRGLLAHEGGHGA